MAKPDFWDRVFARAVKREAVLAEIRRDTQARISGNARPQSTPTARARWKKAVATALAKTNGDRGRAVMQVNRDNPGLRERMLAEVNAGRTSTVARAKTTSRPAAVTGSAQARWKAAISQKISSGVSRGDAVMAVNRENPGLRERMLKEVNTR